MTYSIYTGRAIACLLIVMAAMFHAEAQTTPYGPHVWDKPVDPAVFEKRVNEQLDLAQKSVDQLLAVKGARTVQNTLEPYDQAVEALDTAGYQSYAMQIVNPNAAIRDRAQAMVQKVSAAATTLALNQSLYHALAALDVSKADSATQYYMKRTLLKFRKNADLRKRIFLAYNNRAYPQNIAVLADLLKKREELANLLGYKHWADMNAADKMAVNAPNIAKFINEIDVASKPAAEREYKMLLASAQKQDPSLQQVPLSDRSYYFEQLRRSEFDFNSQSARPYFPYDRVQQGILDVASRLFGVTFQPAKDAVVWDPSVTAFDVYDGSKQLGRIYLDMHPRPGKDQWFSSNPLLDGK